MTHDRVEPWTGPPASLWVVQGVLPVIWLGLLAWLAWRSARAGRASFGLLVLVSFSSLFWQDGYINWGMSLLYNPHQALMAWGATPFTAPRKVWWTISGYGLFWLAAVPAALGLAEALRRRLPTIGSTAAVILTGMPVFYVWDLVFEGLAVKGGFYSYVSYWGPALVMPLGNMPLVFPILFIAAWATAAIWLVRPLGHDGAARFEGVFALRAIDSRPVREAARMGVWILVLNLFHIAFAIAPLTAIRLLLLQPSPLVP